MKCLNCEGGLFENEFKDLQCVNCGSIYPFSNKGLSNGGCAKTEDIIDLIDCLEARIGVYETCNARKDEAIKYLESEVKKLQAECDNLKDILYDADGVDLVNYWYQQCKIAENGCRNFEEENKKLKAEVEKWQGGVERLKEYATQGFWEENAYVSTDQIDNLLKEFERKESTTYDD